ncbi:unnamed protein product [Aureobasidium pullulans]|nr:unnamed protein product [Aureobasidium pullulans]
MPDDAEDGNNNLLRGVVLCSTSLPQELRDKLNDLAKSMGAVHRLDLTADVTHLIVGNIDTPKCKHTAKERPDIHVLKPEWINAIRKAYMEDQDIDVDALAQEYRLPVFYNLHICVTGFEDNLIQKIGDNGAHYHGDLTREVTHLIVAKPKGAKYDRAKTWNLKTVSKKWLDESLERGMAVDEDLYHPLAPVEDQGYNAFDRTYQRPPVLGKRQRHVSANTSMEEAGRRKMRRTASAKLADHSQSMMTSFLSHGGDEPSEVANDQWKDPKNETSRSRTRTRSASPSRPEHDISRHASRGPTPLHEEEHRLFSGILCLVHGHDNKKAAKIDEIITSNGGQITHSTDALYTALDKDKHQRTVLVLPSEWTSLTKGSIPEVPPETWLVTEWWLERCIKQKIVLDPNHDVLSQPHLRLPIDGASYDETLLPKTSILVVPGAASNPKISYAAKHKILVVLDDWLFSSLQNLTKMPTFDYSKGWLICSTPLSYSERNVAPSLHLYHSGPARPVPQQKTELERRGPFIEEDEDEVIPANENNDELREPIEQFGVETDDPPPFIAENDVIEVDVAQGIQPLQNIPPEVNSARRQSKPKSSGDMEIHPAPSSLQKDKKHESESAGLATEDENTSTPSAEAAQANQVRLSGEIKSLLERQHSHPGPSPVEQPAKGRWRKDKKLGRAPSYTSNSSASVSFRQHPGMDTANSGPLASLIEADAPAPSQQVTYEMPDAQEYRAKMSKKMGTRLMDDSIGTRVESPGLVRDVDASGGTGVGGRLLSPPPSPAPQNLSTEINTATRSVHTRLNKLIVSRVPLALPPIAKSPELYAHGINTFGDIYLVFENCWRALIADVDKSQGDDSTHSAKLRRWLSQLVPPSLWRSDAIKKDVEYLETTTGVDLEGISNEQLRAFTEHIYRQTREKPHVLVAYAWIMYMAIFSGGRWIREQLTNAGPEFWGAHNQADKTDYWVHGTLRPGFTLFCFSGTRDGEDIKADFKIRLEKAEELLTERERQDIIDEAQFIFEQCVAIVESLDSQLMTDLELVKSLASREAKHGTSHVKTTPTRAALPENVAQLTAEPKSAGLIRAIMVAFFAFAFYQSYRWQYGDVEDA